MKVLIVIIFLATISNSDGSACAKIPEMTGLYKQAEKIVGWKPSEVPKIKLDENLEVQTIVNQIAEFKTSYEEQDSETMCETILCDQFGLVSHIDKFPKEWAKIPKANRLAIEKFLDNSVVAHLKLSPEYCKQIAAKTKQIADKAKSLPKLSFAKFSSADQEIGGRFEQFVRGVAVVDKTQCGRLHHLKGLKVDETELDSADWKTLPPNHLNQIKDFLKFSNQIYDNLNTFKRAYPMC